MGRLPRLSAVLSGHEPILKRLSKAERKAAEQAAMQVGAARWFADYAPMRFTRYATAKLSYRLKSGHLKRKKNHGVPEPLVWSGETRVSILTRARIVVSGTAGNPKADITMPLPGPRAAIVVEVLNRILDEELGGVAEEVARELTETLSGAVAVSKRSKRLTLTSGPSTKLGSVSARRQQALRGDRGDARIEAVDRQVAITRGRPAHQAAVARRLKRTHDQWRRTSGGAAGTPGGSAQPSQSYLRSPRYRHARQQAAYRARY